MPNDYSPTVTAKAWKLKIKHLEPSICEGGKHRCSGKFIKTYPEQQYCRYCEKFLLTALRIEGESPISRKVEVQSNENTDLNKSHFAETLVSTTEKRAESRERNEIKARIRLITGKERERRLSIVRRWRKKHLELARARTREYMRRKRAEYKNGLH